MSSSRLPTAAVLAWAVLGIDILVVVVGGIASAVGLMVPYDLDLRPVNVYALSILAFAFLGALIATRRPENRLGWVFTANRVRPHVGLSRGRARGLLRLPRPDARARGRHSGVVLRLERGPPLHPIGHLCLPALPRRPTAVTALASARHAHVDRACDAAPRCRHARGSASGLYRPQQPVRAFGALRRAPSASS